MEQMPLPLFFLLLLTLAGVPGCTEDPAGACVRHLDSHFLLNLAKNFHHIDYFASLINKLREDKVINEFTYAILMQRLSESTHDNCQLPVRHKRQVAAAAVAFIGGALISPLIGHMLHPDYATTDDLMKYNSFLKDLSQHINNLEERVRYLERQSEVLELLMGIMLALEVEQDKFTELKSRNTFSTTVNRFLQPVREKYEMFKILQKSRTLDIQAERLPHSTWKMSVKMLKNQNCSEASLQVAVYAAVPSKECLKVEESETDYVLLKKGKKFLVLPPLTTMTLLPDGSLFATTNYFVTKDSNITGLNFDFEYKNGVFLAAPAKNGSAIGDCGEVHNVELKKENGVAVNVGCSAYLTANSKRPKISDLYGPRIKAWSPNESEIQHLKKDSFLYIDEDQLKVPEKLEAQMEPLPEAPTTIRTTGERVELKMLLGACGAIGSATMAFLAWRLMKRVLAPLLKERRPQPRPSIIIVHKDPLKEDLKRSDDLIQDLKSMLELHPIPSYSSFNSDNNEEDSESRITSAQFHKEMEKEEVTDTGTCSSATRGTSLLTKNADPKERRASC